MDILTSQTQVISRIQVHTPYQLKYVHATTQWFLTNMNSMLEGILLCFVVRGEYSSE